MYFVYVTAEQQFSMPIQCTDDTGEQVEELFSSSSRTDVEGGLTSGALASRGASPEDVNFMDDVRFPPSDDDYEFLHSAQDDSVPLPLTREGLSEPISTEMEGSYSHLKSAPTSPEVRGPQQVRDSYTPLWSIH